MDLNDDCIDAVLKFICIEDLVQTRLTCKKLKHLTEQHFFNERKHVPILIFNGEILKPVTTFVGFHHFIRSANIWSYNFPHLKDFSYNEMLKKALQIVKKYCATDMYQLTLSYPDDQIIEKHDLETVAEMLKNVKVLNLSKLSGSQVDDIMQYCQNVKSVKFIAMNAEQLDLKRIIKNNPQLYSFHSNQ